MPRCCGVDHHAAEYTPQQRADLERVHAFNRRVADAIEECRDVAPVEALLDPDPLRYMWVDEGGGRLTEFLARGEVALEDARSLDGHQRIDGRDVTTGGTCVRPAVAVAGDGTRVFAWLEWVPGQGERLLATAVRADGPGDVQEPVVLSPAPGLPPADHFRPTACTAADGTVWVAWARSDAGRVAVWCSRLVDGEWTAQKRVSPEAHPSFNVELAAHCDGGVEVCWQGPHGAGFGIWSRRTTGDGWTEPALVSDTAEGNVWDPAVVALPAGGSAYAWSEYVSGSYRVCVRTSGADGLGPVRPLTSGTDYALHPSLAVTTDGALWCAFDVLVVHGHAGSGPTRLRPAERVGEPVAPEEMRSGGAAIPPELLPQVEAGIRVLRVDDDGLLEPPGELASRLDVTPGGMPRLVADPGGGLTVAYRVHRRLPLMTYYWEVAAQSLTPSGWTPPRTFAGSDATLEEPAVAALPSGVVVAWQCDDRRSRGLEWTEGFGGRECPYLLEHQGEVVWHGMHGTGRIRTGELTTTAVGPLTGGRPGTVESSTRREARGWLTTAGEAAGGRYTTRVDGRELTLYWGDLHRHSLTSRCTAGDEPSLEDFYRYSWDVCEYDFWAVTDHSENSSDYQWWSIQKIADLFRVDGRFVPLYGFEWTGDTGHQNVIYGDVPRGAPIYSAYADGSSTPDELWQHLRRHDLPVLTIPHHPGSAMVPMEWDYYDEDLMRLVEVFQACRGNYEDDGCFRQYSDGILTGTFTLDGLRRGHRFGLIASSDHGHGAAYVGAFAEALDRRHVFEALHARRTFAATSRNLLVDLRVAGAFMGTETTVDGEQVAVNAVVRGFRDIARVDVVRNGRTVHTLEPDPALPATWVRVPVRVEWGGSPVPTDWSGSLTVEGGEILQTPWWSPEIVAVSRDRVAWQATTTSFGEVYGAQRGGIEVTVVGPPSARVVLSTAQGGGEAALGDLAERARDGHGSLLARFDPQRGHLRLQGGVGGLIGLGTTRVTLEWTDPDGLREAGAVQWYYVRVTQVDGEMAWSSPVWVRRDT